MSNTRPSKMGIAYLKFAHQVDLASMLFSKLVPELSTRVQRERARTGALAALTSSLRSPPWASLFETLLRLCRIECSVCTKLSWSLMRAQGLSLASGCVLAENQKLRLRRAAGLGSWDHLRSLDAAPVVIFITASARSQEDQVEPSLFRTETGLVCSTLQNVDQHLDKRESARMQNLVELEPLHSLQVSGGLHNPGRYA